MFGKTIMNFHDFCQTLEKMNYVCKKKNDELSWRVGPKTMNWHDLWTNDNSDLWFPAKAYDI